MYEYIANILYALVIRRLPTFALAILVGLFGCLTVNLALNLDVFGLLTARTSEAYTFIGGWSISTEQVFIGFTRLLYPFFCGLLISRVGRLIKLNRGFWWCSLMVVIVLVVPRLGGTAHSWINGLYEGIAILFIFPLIVSIGAGSNVSGKRSVEICKFLGLISYPLYITHYPLIYMQKAWVQAHPDAPLAMHVAVSVSCFVLSVLIAFAALKLYDLPVREYLKERFLHKAPKAVHA